MSFWALSAERLLQLFLYLIGFADRLPDFFRCDFYTKLIFKMIDQPLQFNPVIFFGGVAVQAAER